MRTSSKIKDAFLLVKPPAVGHSFPENPINKHLRNDALESRITLYEYNNHETKEHVLKSAEDCQEFKESANNLWINIEGLKKEEIKTICDIFEINELTEKDIYSVGHTTKVDVYDSYIYCLGYMLDYNASRFFIEQDQISIILSKTRIITLQENIRKDFFKKIKTRLQSSASKLRQNGVDFLFYELLDAIVDDYFYLMDKLSIRIEKVEDEILNLQNKRSFGKIIFYRKELMILRRNIYPLREAITILLRNDQNFFAKKTLRYLKDVSDHINQAREMVENYRESITNIQDLYLNQENNKLNQSMKVTAIVTCLLAPATVIGGVFGMNFEHIPFLHNTYAFIICLALMLLIPLYMIYVFKKKGWF